MMPLFLHFLYPQIPRAILPRITTITIKIIHPVPQPHVLFLVSCKGPHGLPLCFGGTFTSLVHVRSPHWFPSSDHTPQFHSDNWQCSGQSSSQAIFVLRSSHFPPGLFISPSGYVIYFRVTSPILFRGCRPSPHVSGLTFFGSLHSPQTQSLHVGQAEHPKPPEASQHLLVLAVWLHTDCKQQVSSGHRPNVVTLWQVCSAETRKKNTIASVDKMMKSVAFPSGWKTFRRKLAIIIALFTQSMNTSFDESRLIKYNTKII